MAVESLTLLAMKGHPGCGKSSVAESLAKSLRWPLVDKDDIRDCTHPTQNFIFSLTESSSSSSSVMNDLSYAAMWKVAETQLRLGASVIVDCPLARPHLFQRAGDLATQYSARLLIVECTATDPQEWKRRLQDRAQRSPSWHKPSCWEDVQKLMEGYQECWKYDTGNTLKLVVDTTAADVEEEQMNGTVLHWVRFADGSTPTVTFFP